MAKPSISTRIKRPPWRSPRPLMRLLILVLSVLCAPAGGSLGPNTPAADAYASPDRALWSQADAMVNRLREERRKLRLIFEELERLEYMGQDFRDLQLYPTRVTHLGPEDDVRLDRMIEGLEKNLAASRKQVIELQRPLDDAYFIAKEMLQETPNQDMVDLLLKDNVERIARLVTVQRELNKRWDDAFALLAEYRLRIGLAKGVPGDAIGGLAVAHARAGDFSGSVRLTGRQAAALRNQALYIRIDSAKAPDGNLQGWLEAK